MLIYDTTSKEVTLAIEGAHESVPIRQICSSFAFSEDGRMAYSGGFDCALRGWRVDSGTKVTDIDVRRLYLGLAVGDTMVNPPHIYNLAVCGNSLAAALGSGHLLVYSLSSDIPEVS